MPAFQSMSFVNQEFLSLLFSYVIIPDESKLTDGLKASIWFNHRLFPFGLNLKGGLVGASLKQNNRISDLIVLL